MCLTDFFILFILFFCMGFLTKLIFFLSSQDTDTQTVSTVFLTLRTPSCWFVVLQNWEPGVLPMDVLHVSQLCLGSQSNL